MIDPKKKSHRSAGPQSVHGPAVLVLFACVSAIVVSVVGIAPPGLPSRTSPAAEESFAPPVPGALTPSPAFASVGGHGAADSALAVRTDALRYEGDPTRREEGIRSILDCLESEGFSAAMPRLAALAPGPPVDQLAARIMRRWAESDIRAAANWAASSPGGALRPASLEQVALVWAGRDPACASEWARSLRSEAERADALRLIAHEVVRTDPVAALAMAAGLPAGEPRDQLFVRAASEWAATAPENAALWARKIPDLALREKILAGVAVAWGEREPVMAATLAAKELPPGRPQSDAVVSIVQRWGQVDPQAAARWVAGFPESMLRDAALDCLSRLWSGDVRGESGGS